jgi:hypothetical protein
MTTLDFSLTRAEWNALQVLLHDEGWVRASRSTVDSDVSTKRQINGTVAHSLEARGYVKYRHGGRPGSSLYTLTFKGAKAMGKK